MLTVFVNESFTDFTQEEYYNAMKSALASVKEQLGREYPLVIGGKKYTTYLEIKSMNPADFGEAIGTVSQQKVHRCIGRGKSIWGLQYVRHEFHGRRTGLSDIIHAIKSCDRKILDIE
ncbi:MAG: hypothetical protein ACOZCL_01815 [Bacillota bacterium]